MAAAADRDERRPVFATENARAVVAVMDLGGSPSARPAAVIRIGQNFVVDSTPAGAPKISWIVLKLGREWHEEGVWILPLLPNDPAEPGELPHNAGTAASAVDPINLGLDLGLSGLRVIRNRRQGHRRQCSTS